MAIVYFLSLNNFILKTTLIKNINVTIGELNIIQAALKTLTILVKIFRFEVKAIGGVS